MRTALTTAIALVLLAILPACDKEEMPEGMDQVSVFVSIQPQVFFAEQIGGKYVDAQPMVTPGQSPATYEPTPAQMSALETAELYFAIGVPFEKSLLPRIEELHPDLRVVNTHEGIERRHLSEHDHGDGEQVTHDDLDPHIWLDPELARKVAQRMGEVLTEAASEQAGAFSENLVNLELRLDSLDARIRRQLQDLEHRTFYVFHPAYGYFADAYGLNQVAVEVGGKEPSAQQIADFIEQARADSIQLILVQPQFSTAAAETIAEEVGAEVVTIDPLAHDYFDTMNKLAETLSRSLGGVGGK